MDRKRYVETKSPANGIHVGIGNRTEYIQTPKQYRQTEEVRNR